MTTNLMRWMIKLCKLPECSPCYFPIHKSLYIIEDCIFNHRSLYNIISMRFSRSACCNKIKPFIRHFFKLQILQCRIRNIIITIHISLFPISGRPPFCLFLINSTIKTETSVYKGYKQDKIEMRGDRAEMSDFPLYLNTVAGGLDRRDQTIGGFSFVVKIYAVPVVEIIG